MVEKSDFVRLTKSWADMVPRYVDFKRYFMRDKFIFFQLSIYFILYDYKLIIGRHDTIHIDISDVKGQI